MSISYKDFLSRGLMITLLAFVPTHSFSSSVTLSKYARVHYHGEFFDGIGNFDGSEDAKGAATDKIIGHYNKDNKIGIYRPEYKPGFAGGGAVGFSIEHPAVPGNIRVEFEGLYSQVNVKSDDYASKGDKDYAKRENASLVELIRDTATSAGAGANLEWASNLNNDPANAAADDHRASFKIRNEGFNNIAQMINVYYDFVREGNPITPYFGIGGGITRIEHLKAVEYDFAYQGKVGISYTVAPNAKVFVGYRIFNRFGDKFNKVKPLHQISAGTAATADEARVESTTATITNKFSVRGIEAGFVLNF